MKSIRVIARIDIKGENAIKGVHLEGLRIVGQPQDLSRKYYIGGADELLFVDSVASLYGRSNIIPIVKNIAKDVFIPITIGGGIRTTDDIKKILRSGADKVAINTAAVKNINFISDAVNNFGGQCIVLSVEAIKVGEDQWEVMIDNGREKTGIDVLEWVGLAEEKGVGELLITSVDKEGTREGFDVRLIEMVSDNADIPVVACGGAGDLDHIKTLMQCTYADAIAVASVLHYEKFSIEDIKIMLKSIDS